MRQASPGPESTTTPSGPQSPRLLDQLRSALEKKGHGLDACNRCVEWCRQYILFHNKRHPRDMGTSEVRQFLDDLAIGKRLPVAWQREAVLASVLLYREVLRREIELPEVGRHRRGGQASDTPAPGAQPAEQAPRLLERVLEAIEGYGGLYRLMTRLMYGTGLRRMECCRQPLQPTRD